MEMKPTCSFIELRKVLSAFWRVSGQNSQCVARPWCVAHVQICPEKSDLMRSVPWTCSATLRYFWEAFPVSKLDLG